MFNFEERTDCDRSSDDNQSVAVKQYEEEWKSLFSIITIGELQNIAVSGKLRTSRFRSVCWRLLLKILPSDSAEWLTFIVRHRLKYEQIKLTHYNDPHSQDSRPDDPLSQDDDSIWKQYFKDVELKRIIQQDVVRTSPGVEFFRTEKIQNIMINVLFCYSREHADLCYRQGMHEILAPLLFVLHCDHQALLHVLEQSTSDVSDLIMKILDPAYLEADVYSLFSTIMEIMKDYYNISDCMMSSIVLDQSEAVKVASSTSESEVVRKLSKIRDTMLMKHDPELYGHFMDLDISFTIFGVRWLRLLFGGEFSLMDLLVLWDTIFAKSPQHFAIVNHIFVAMLVLIRIQLLKSDNTNCLNYLMRYPHVDVMSVIEYALHLSDPEMYALPSVIDSLKHDKRDNLKSKIIEDQPERPTNVVRQLSTRRTNSSSDDLLELCRIKLYQYHSILSPAVPNHNKEARQALSGILELCEMLNYKTRPGIIEMGKDVANIPLKTPITPESPERPLLPPPASAITMKVFRKTKSSTDSQIQGAPTKNPLKQMKRFQQDYDNTIGNSNAKIPRINQLNDMASNDREIKNLIQTKTSYNKNVITIKLVNNKNDIKQPVNINLQQNLDSSNNGLKEFIKLSDNLTFPTYKMSESRQKIVNISMSKIHELKPTKHNIINLKEYTPIDEQDKSVINIEPRLAQQNTIKIKSYSKPVCSNMCLISLALRNSPTGAMYVSEIFEFMCIHFPYFRTTNECWRKSIRKCLHSNTYYFQSTEVQKKMLWSLKPNRIREVNQIITNWAISSPVAIKKSMSDPDQMERLTQGISDTSAKDNSTIENKNKYFEEVEEEELLASDSDDPFSQVTLTPEDINNMVHHNVDQHKSHGSQQLLDTSNYSVAQCKKIKNSIDMDREEKLQNQFILTSIGKKRMFLNQNLFLHNGKEIPKAVSMAWNQMTAEERRPYMEESLRLGEMLSRNKSMANKVNSIDQYQPDKTKHMLFNTSLYNYSVAQGETKYC